MRKWSNLPNAISLSLAFSNGKRHRFNFKIPPGVYTFDACKMIGVNAAGERFELDGLGKALLRFLVQLDLATKQMAAIEDVAFKLSAPPRNWDISAAFAAVSVVEEAEPTANSRAPEASVACPMGT
jgi:hypothetical protein